MSKLKPFKISMPPEDMVRFRNAQADAKRLVNSMLSEPRFSEIYRDGSTFFAKFATKFDDLVPPKRALKVKRLFKKIKEIDPEAFTELKALRTILGCLVEEQFNLILQNYRDFLSDLSAHKHTIEEGRAHLYINIIRVLDVEVGHHLPPPEPGVKRINAQFIDRIIADQSKLTPLRLWLKTYLYGYIILRHLNDSPLWDQPVDRTIKLKDLFNVKWGMVRTIDRMLSERLSKKKEGTKPQASYQPAAGEQSEPDEQQNLEQQASAEQPDQGQQSAPAAQPASDEAQA